jgi:WD40 repeat protein
MPLGASVLRIKFFSDKKHIIFSLSNGLIIIYNSLDYEVVKVLVNKYAILDSLKLVEDRYLMTAGIDHKIRIWNTDTGRIISKLNVH